MKHTLVISAALLLAFPTACSAQVEPNAVEGDEIVEVLDNDPQMYAAMDEAQRTLPRFLAILADPPPGSENFVFKYPLEGWEHIWVDITSRDGDYLVGTLGNNPHAPGHAIGEEVRVPLSDVSDWGYVNKDGVAQGYFTLKVMFDHMPPEQVAQIKRDYGWE